MNKLLLLSVAAAFAACAVDTSERRGPVVRDSAGIRIVENTTHLWQDGEAWRLSPEPVVDIGGGDREEDQLFRVVGALRLGDDRIVVANGGTNEIRFYGPGGTFLSAAGGEGEGPGEFRQLSVVRRLRGDSLFAQDVRLYRSSVFDGQGRFIRTVQPQASRGRSSIDIVFDDGMMLGSSIVRLHVADVELGLFRMAFTFYRFDGAGDLVDTLGVYPGFELYMVTSQGGIPSTYPHPMSRATYFQFLPDGYYVADNDTYEVQKYAPDGKLQQIVRRLTAPVQVEPQHMKTLRERALAAVTNDDRRRSTEQFYRDMPVPETFPAYGGIAVSVEGYLWVREYDLPGNEANNWSVFDAEGTLLGTLELPPRFKPLDIGPDYVLGLWRDADDVEHVRMYELVKSE
ncbi:MAG: hypothetical protein IIA27_15625 [Gemmatimonadetes bacterium]|nr:hypothetical protein [Gemmatimonadota bacterium]